MASGSHSSNAVKRDANGMDGDDGDNRTRNAKAQRRHREKRKAHLKALEDSVQVLTAQLEDARRQLGHAAYASSRHGQPLSPQSKDYPQLHAENVYLRDENADLRRQVYTYRVNYGYLPPPPPAAEQQNKQGGGWGGDVKLEGAFGVTYDQSSMESPQRAGSAGRGPPRQSGEFVGDSSAQPNTESSSASSSTASYPPQMDHFTPINSRSRNRVLSSSSAPSASPYLPSNSFPEQRYASDPNGPGPGPSPVRYESLYPAPPPHNLPRSGPGIYEMTGHNHSYAPRPDGDAMSWGPESGPPAFQGPVQYPIGFGQHESQQGGEEWRQEH